MRVLTVSHLYPNPAEPLKGVFVAELVSALAKLAELRVAAPVSFFPLLRSRSELPRHSATGIVPVAHPRYLALPQATRNARWIPFQRALARSLRDFAANGVEPQILHAHWLYPDGYAAARLARRIGAKSVVTVHGHASLGLGIGGLPTPKCREALRLVDLVVTVSEELRRIAIEQFGVSEGRVVVLHNGIDPGKFLPLGREQARRALGLPLNRRIVLCVARLSEEKQLHLFIDAMARLKHLPLQAFIVGEGPLRARLLRLVEQRALQNRVILIGGIPHEALREWYYSADVCCLTSAHEGCPVVVHEALACGIPVVSTPVGAVPDLVRAGENGFLAAPEVEAIASSIETALQWTWNLDAISRDGQTQTWDKVAGETLALYARLLRLRDP